MEHIMAVWGAAIGWLSGVFRLWSELLAGLLVV